MPPFTAPTSGCGTSGWDAEALPADLAEAEAPVLALLPDESLAADALAAGARGLLLREASVETLCRTIEAVVEGLLVLDPALLGALQPVAPRPDEAPPAEPLTGREREVLQLLAEGLSNRAIAQALAISEHTVKFHVNAIMSKLDAQSRTEAVVRATRLGLILL
jgi:DNA-binding NarL/FixJ family response regulator